MTPNDKPEVYAAYLVAMWAQRFGLPPGNLWEPPMVRNVLADYHRLKSWAAVREMYCLRFGACATDTEAS